jgi:L-alanine-DL-glutamate epimerase-like enolase superfamily enzyme
VFDGSDLVVVELTDGKHRGRGEARGVYYLGDEAPQIVECSRPIARASKPAGAVRSFGSLLPPGGARNAVDCAMWELEASRQGVPAYKLAGFDALRPLVTTFTLGADEPEVMAQGARNYADARAIKIKLTGRWNSTLRGSGPSAMRRPDVWIGVDANQGYGISDLGALVEALERLNVSLIEQPLRRGAEADLDGFASIIPWRRTRARSASTMSPGSPGRFQVINIKLDKCGGLTEALLMANEARRIGLGVMVGNMVGTSLAMAPAFILGQLCEIVDLDGPTFLKADRVPSVEYREGLIWCPDKVWGTPSAIVPA